MGYVKNKMIEEQGAMMAEEALGNLPKQEEKKGFFGFLKPQRKILGNYELQDLILSTSAKNSSEIDFLKAALLEEVKALNDLSNIIKKKQDEEMIKKDPFFMMSLQIKNTFPQFEKLLLSEIEGIIKAFVYLPDEGAKAEIFAKIQEKNNPNLTEENEKCYKCGFPLIDGEYYITEQGLKGCLYHMTEPESKISIKDHLPGLPVKTIKSIKKQKVVKNADKKNKLL